MQLNRRNICVGLLCLQISTEAFCLMPSKQIYDCQGLPMRGFLSEKNTYYRPVSLADISPWLVAAAVSAEDKRFFTHEGVDGAAILRALWQNTKKGEVVSGASTITQQLVRAVEPRPKTVWGKAGEAWNALQLEQHKTKEEILEDYFNWLELGNLTQGVEAASLFYFGVNAADVSLAQAAFLAGLAKSPTYYNPLKHKARAIKRQKYVLTRMLEEGFIDEELYQIALQEPLELCAVRRPFEAPHFTQLLRPLIPTDTTDVFSTLDQEVQSYAQKMVQTHLRSLADDHVTNAAVIILENNTGAVLAYVGSANFNDVKNQGQIDGVRALRQPGSALKPFVYALALERNLLTPASLLSDEDTFFEGGFRPRNYDESYHGWVSVRTALACSYNIPAVKAAEKTGTAALLALLRQAGLTTLTKEADFYGLGLSLGNGEVRLLDLANAYATLARGGLYKPLLLSTRPEIYLPGNTKRVLRETTAYLITHILMDNQARSGAFGLNSALSVPFEMAAKTGTSKDYRDNFALGYTPRWTIGVWVGNFNAAPMQKVSGVTGAGPILHDLAIFLQQKYPSETFIRPEGVSVATVCNESGLLAGPACSHTHEDVFEKGHLPAICDGHHMDHTPFELLAPTDHDVYKWDPAVPPASQRLKWEAQGCKEAYQWLLDGKKYDATHSVVWWPITVGKHTLTVTCGKEKRQVTFEVLP